MDKTTGDGSFVPTVLGVKAFEKAMERARRMKVKETDQKADDDQKDPTIPSWQSPSSSSSSSSAQRSSAGNGGGSNRVQLQVLIEGFGPVLEPHALNHLGKLSFLVVKLHNPVDQKLQRICSVNPSYQTLCMAASVRVKEHEIPAVLSVNQDKIKELLVRHSLLGIVMAVTIKQELYVVCRFKGERCIYDTLLLYDDLKQTSPLPKTVPRLEQNARADEFQAAASLMSAEISGGDGGGGSSGNASLST